MGEISVKRPIEQPAERVWELIADFGDVSWMPAGTQVEVEGEGEGMSRLIGGGENRIREVLVSRDAASKTLVYEITENLPFPVTGYRATMIVTGSGPGCELEWRCRFEPKGVTEAEAGAAIEGMYGVMIGWIADRAGSS